MCSGFRTSFQSSLSSRGEEVVWRGGGLLLLFSLFSSSSIEDYYSVSVLTQAS